MNHNPSKFSRRSFFKNSALGVIGTVSVPAFLNGCSTGTGTGSEESKLKDVAVPEILKSAPDGKLLKAGLVGC
jgi:hypothetical protein